MMASMPKTTSLIPVFRPGRHTSAAGDSLEFSDGLVRQIAESYDPAVYRAPIVIGHPKTDDPAWGWVGALAYQDGHLAYRPEEVDPAFADLEAAGRYRNKSIALWSPEAPSNPHPGKWALRHVGYLGAAPPALKGLPQRTLREVGFADADADAGVVEFSGWDDRQVAALFRRLREWIIGQFGADAADAAVPGYEIDSLATAAEREIAAEMVATAEPDGPAYSQGDEMSEPDKARLAELEAENARLKAEAAAREADGRHAEHLAYCDTLVAGGKLLPAWRDFAVATLDHLTAAPATLEFGEGDARVAKPGAEAFRAFLAALPKVVEFSEVATAQRCAAGGGGVEFAAPGGYGVDAEALALHNKAVAYQAAHPDTDYMTAVRAVS